MGTFVSTKVLNPSAALLYQYIRKHSLPKGFEDWRALHCSVIWSKKVCENLEADKEKIFEALPLGFHVFHSHGKKRLALMIDSPSITARHEYVMNKYKADYPWPEFHPHITLAYDIGDFDWWKLPPIKHSIILGEEEVRSLKDRSTERRPGWRKVLQTLKNSR